jgi:hypothetical protein
MGNPLPFQLSPVFNTRWIDNVDYYHLQVLQLLAFWKLQNIPFIFVTQMFVLLYMKPLLSTYC